MANLTRRLTLISSNLRSGPAPGRRLLAIVLCAMLIFGSVFPGFAFAGEADSEGVGTVPEMEVPVAPDLDPGGEETGLEETPATGGEEEGGTVELEPEVEVEVPPVDEVTNAATEAPSEAPPEPIDLPREPAAATPPEAELVPQEVVEPVENQPLQAPRAPADRKEAASSQTDGTEAPVAEAIESRTVSAGLTEEDAPDPTRMPSSDSGLSLAGKRFYVVQPGDCLTHIAEALLPTGATKIEIEDKVDRLWRLNEDRIGTGDPNLIYVGTVLQLS